MRKLWVVVISAILMQGCSTEFLSNLSLRGTYDEVQLEQNVFKVTFSGDEYTSSEQASDLALRRSAELTLLHGYKYFVVLSSSNTKEEINYPIPVTSYPIPVTGYTTIYGNTAPTTNIESSTYNRYRPKTSNTVIFYMDKPLDIFAYNAEFVYQSLTTKYGL